MTLMWLPLNDHLSTLHIDQAAVTPSEPIGSTHSLRLQTGFCGLQEEFSRALSEAVKHGPQDDNDLFQAAVSSVHCRHTFATLTKNIMEDVFPSSDDVSIT